MDSTISGNSAGFIPANLGPGVGGGIANFSAMTITGSTISGNSAVVAAGIYNNGMLTISNSTVSGNTAHPVQGYPASGGGLVNVNGPLLTITHSTISDNTASGNGDNIRNSAPLRIGNAILKVGTTGTNIVNNSPGTVTSEGYNLSSDNFGGFLTAAGDQINATPMLGPLQNNGGPTSTHKLLPGSLGIDAGDPNFIPPPFFDQRGPGFDRVVGGRIDIGAFEAQPTPTPTPTPTP
jgi:hypothetical protein